MKGYEIRFNIYAENEQEVEEARQAICAFIRSHAEQGRAVTAKRVADAVSKWDSNPIVRSRIINYLTDKR